MRRAPRASWGCNKGKWTRRGFIVAGTVAGGALVVGVAIRPEVQGGHVDVDDVDIALLATFVPLVGGEGENAERKFARNSAFEGAHR